MSSYLKKSLLAEQLQKELEELSKNEDAKKEKQFFEDLKSVLDEHEYSFHQLHSMLSDVLEFEKPTKKTTRKSAWQGLEIEYEGSIYKVNSIGRQPAQTKELLDSIEMTPTEFIERFKK